MGKKVTGSFVAVVLYVLIDGIVSFSQALSSMDQSTWDKMWWMQRTGFWLGQVGSTALIVKAFYSGSAPKT
jgi:hypothetical protein